MTEKEMVKHRIKRTFPTLIDNSKVGCLDMKRD